MAWSIMSGDDNLCQNNIKVQKLISYRIISDIFNLNDKDHEIKIGKLDKNYFSFTFSIDISSKDWSGSFYVKIPKSNVGKSMPYILPITHDDRQLAIGEKVSLKRLEECWVSGDKKTEWVKLVGFVPEYNALVTTRIFAREGLSVFRKLSLLGKVGFAKQQEKLNRFMFDFGNSLGSTHLRQKQSSTFFMETEIKKIEYYCNEINKLNGSNLVKDVYSDLLCYRGFSIKASLVSTLKGIDVRNFLVDDFEKIHLLDPGRSKLYFLESDLARFIITLRILFWGSPIFLLTRGTVVENELAFLYGYNQASGSSSSALLNFFLLKEILKHWYVALLSLDKREWPYVFNVITRRVYVDGFYERQVRLQMKLIRGHFCDQL